MKLGDANSDADFPKRQLTDAQRAAFYRDALRRAVSVINDICDTECCCYGHEAEIEELDMIAHNRKACQHFYVDGNFDMCRLYECFCVEGRLPACRVDRILFPEDEPSCDAGKSPSEEIDDKHHSVVGMDFASRPAKIRTVSPQYDKDGYFIGLMNCNGGDCERRSHGDAACSECKFYDEKGCH